MPNVLKVMGIFRNFLATKLRAPTTINTANKRYSINPKLNDNIYSPSRSYAVILDGPLLNFLLLADIHVANNSTDWRYRNADNSDDFCFVGFLEITLSQPEDIFHPTNTHHNNDCPYQDEHGC